MNLFEDTNVRFEEQATRDRQNFRKGLAEGRDIGGTEMRIRAIDLAANVHVKARASKKRLEEYFRQHLK
jgi:hypothetical protein